VVVRETEKNKSLENAGSDALLSKLGGANAGLPFFVFLTAQGQSIATSKRPVAGRVDGLSIGHPYQPEEIGWFMTMVKMAAPGMTEGQAKTIEDWLRNQKKS
jgi:hypothetical protein